MGANICIPSEVSVVDGLSFGGFDGTGFWYCVCISAGFCVWETYLGGVITLVDTRFEVDGSVGDSVPSLCLLPRIGVFFLSRLSI